MPTAFQIDSFQNDSFQTDASVGGPIWPLPTQVLLGVVYGPTGTEYTGTLSGGGSKLKFWDGTAWVLSTPKHWNGSAWI